MTRPLSEVVREEDQGVAADAAALAPFGLSPCGSQAEPPAANAGLREVYRSTTYSPELVVRTYAKENRAFEEGGYRVVETNAERQTIREFVTQSDEGFSQEHLAEMRQLAEAGTSPSWVLISDSPLVEKGE